MLIEKALKVIDCTFKAFLWSQLGSNQRPSDYESDALTD